MSRRFGVWKEELKMPHELKFMHLLLGGAFLIAVVAIVLFWIAGLGKPKK